MNAYVAQAIAALLCISTVPAPDLETSTVNLTNRGTWYVEVFSAALTQQIVMAPDEPFQLIVSIKYNPQKKKTRGQPEEIIISSQIMG